MKTEKINQIRSLLDDLSEDLINVSTLDQYMKLLNSFVRNSCSEVHNELLKHKKQMELWQEDKAKFDANQILMRKLLNYSGQESYSIDQAGRICEILGQLSTPEQLR